MAPKRKTTDAQQEYVDQAEPKRTRTDDSDTASESEDDSSQKSSTPVVDPDPVNDCSSLEPLQAMIVWTNSSKEETPNSAILPQIIPNPPYTRIHRYEVAKGEYNKVENIALINNPNLYCLARNSVCQQGSKSAVRFFLVGVVTATSNFNTLHNGRHSVLIMPSAFSWGRITGFMRAVFEKEECIAFSMNPYDGLSFSTRPTATPMHHTDTIPTSSIGRSPSKPKPSQASTSSKTNFWPKSNSLAATDQIPVFDGREINFLPAHFRDLPPWPEREVTRWTIVMVIFTLGHYSKGEDMNLSLNLQALIVLHETEMTKRPGGEVMPESPLPYTAYNNANADEN